MYYKRYMLGKELKDALQKIAKTHLNANVTIVQKDGKQIYPTTDFASVIDTDLAEQCMPDIAMRAHKTPDKGTPEDKITVKKLIESAAAVEALEKTHNFEQMAVVVLLHEVDKDGYDEDYPNILPVETIEVIDENTIVLKCNEY